MYKYRIENNYEYEILWSHCALGTNENCKTLANGVLDVSRWPLAAETGIHRERGSDDILVTQRYADAQNSSRRGFGTGSDAKHLEVAGGRRLVSLDGTQDT